MTLLRFSWRKALRSWGGPRIGEACLSSSPALETPHIRPGDTFSNSEIFTQSRVTAFTSNTGSASPSAHPNETLFPSLSLTYSYHHHVPKAQETIIHSTTTMPRPVRQDFRVRWSLVFKWRPCFQRSSGAHFQAQSTSLRRSNSDDPFLLIAPCTHML